MYLAKNHINNNGKGKNETIKLYKDNEPVQQ